jgi:SnoaL-like domain
MILALAFSIGRAPEAQQDTDGVAGRIASLQSKVADIDPLVAYLKDRRDIFDVAKRYTRGADRHDRELIRSAFWPEATISHGTPMGLAEFVDWQVEALATYAGHQHHITGQTIDIDGDTAHVESYVVYFLVPRDSSADTAGAATPGRALTSEKTHLGSGRYVERWERRNGEWRILVSEYIEDLSLEGDTVDLCSSRTCLGTWNREDLSYERPLRTVTPERRAELGERNSRPTSPAAGGAGQ